MSTDEVFKYLLDLIPATKLNEINLTNISDKSKLSNNISISTTTLIPHNENAILKSNISNTDDRVLDKMCKSFAFILVKIDALFKLNTNIPKIYKNYVYGMINTIKETYNIIPEKYYIVKELMDVPYWGNAIWSFLHISSFLIQHGLKTQRIKFTLDLPTILFNIEDMLPCPICISHYLPIKLNPNIYDKLEKMSYGLCVLGVYEFHNIISENIAKSNNTEFKAFSTMDFLLYYNVLPTYITKIEFTNYSTSGLLILEIEQIVTVVLAKLIFSSVDFIKLSKKVKEININKLRDVNEILFNRVNLDVKHQSDKDLYERIKNIHKNNYKYTTFYDINNINYVNTKDGMYDDNDGGTLDIDNNLNINGNQNNTKVLNEDTNIIIDVNNNEEINKENFKNSNMMEDNIKIMNYLKNNKENIEEIKTKNINNNDNNSIDDTNSTKNDGISLKRKNTKIFENKKKMVKKNAL